MVAHRMTVALDALQTRLGEVSDLESVASGLGWDQQVMMPPGGAALRAEAMATLETLTHERFASDEVGRLLDEAAAEPDASEDSFAASLLRVTRRDWDKARRVPGELKAELARTTAIAYEAWADARRRSDWEAFKPHLGKVLELRRRYAECFPEAACAYDALLDDFEPGMTSVEVSRVFAQLRDGLVPLIAEVARVADRVDDSPLHGDFPVERQERLVRRAAEGLGFDSHSWRLDPTVHPFATGYGTQDVRITTRYEPGFLPAALFGTLHETGHGLYESGSDPSLDRTPLAGGVSLGLHESQSRLWENFVGRGRPFSGWLLEQIRHEFPREFAEVDIDRYYPAVNRVAPSLIRVEADEATYSLHVIIRFELEQDMLEGRVSLDDLPEAWNAKYAEYLGLEVPDAAQGILQDVHWSGGAIGYFPTYALGNVMAGQIWDVARAALPDLDHDLSNGETRHLRGWLTERLYRHGRTRTPRETLAHATGGTGELAPEPYLAYLREKLGAVYGLSG